MTKTNKIFDRAAARRIEIARIARGEDAADSDDFHTFLIAWDWHNPGNTKDRAGALMEAATRMGGTISEAEAEQILQEAATTPQCRSADSLARFLRLTYAKRTQYAIKTIGSIDVN